MTNIEAKLNCEWHIADLKLRLHRQHNLDSWEERKKTLVEHH